MTHADLKARRPLSPHLQIYRFTWTMAMSIAHRITGGALYVGSILLVWWLLAAAAGPGYFGTVQRLFGSIPGQIILFGYTWALFHHLLGGIRHLIWDTIHGFDREARNLLARATLAGSVTVTIVVWVIAYAVR